jgi:hypothetical protein
MPGFHTQVRMAKFDYKDFQHTVNMNGIVVADIGKAVTWDNSEDNAVKLAGDGDPICGVIYTVEDRVNEGQLIGTIEMKFAAYLPIKAGLTGAKAVARGKKLCGAGGGEVRAIDVTPTTGDVALTAQNGHPHCWGLFAGKAIGQLI